ncbi:MAG: LLM class F420-dependent oxidoreductase [Acidimicrobiales bacterium]
MTAAPSHPLGLTFASFAGLGPSAGFTAAEWAVESGYSSFWVAETTGLEAFSTLAAIGAAQPKLGLGTGVLAAQLRTPGVTAMGAATLQALHPDRDILLGIGVSSPTVVSRWHGATYGNQPLAQMREELTLLRLCLSGEKVDFAGDFHSVKGFRLGVRLGEKRPKIILAALNPLMLKLAGELADGVVLNYIPASHVPWSVEQVRAGGDAKIYSYVHVGVTEAEPHRDLARKDLFSYIVVDAYADNFMRAGFADEVAQVRECHAAGNRDAALAAVSDRMVDAIDILGDSAHVHSAVQSYVRAGVDVPVIMPMPWGADRMSVIRNTIEASAGRF